MGQLHFPWDSYTFPGTATHSLGQLHFYPVYNKKRYTFRDKKEAEYLKVSSLHWVVAPQRNFSVQINKKWKLFEKEEKKILDFFFAESKDWTTHTAHTHIIQTGTYLLIIHWNRASGCVSRFLNEFSFKFWKLGAAKVESRMRGRIFIFGFFFFLARKKSRSFYLIFLQVVYVCTLCENE